MQLCHMWTMVPVLHMKQVNNDVCALWLDSRKVALQGWTMSYLKPPLLDLTYYSVPGSGGIRAPSIRLFKENVYNTYIFSGKKHKQPCKS